MKRLIVVLATALALTSIAQTNAPVDNFTLVTNLWFNGYKTNVLTIAEQRLAANPNDLAGLIIRMDFNFEFSNEECFSNDIYSVMSVASAITNYHTHSVVPLLLLDLTNQLALLATDYKLLTDEERQADKLKGLIKGKPLEDEDVLKALHDDGLF